MIGFKKKSSSRKKQALKHLILHCFCAILFKNIFLLNICIIIIVILVKKSQVHVLEADNLFLRFKISYNCLSLISNSAVLYVWTDGELIS